MKPMLGVVLAICALLGVTDVASGQVPTGIIPFGSYDGSVDTVNLANLNVHLDIPIWQKAGRGLPFTYDLSYDSSIWYPSTVGGGGTWLPVANWGWKNSGPTLLPYVSYSVIYTNGLCTDFNQFMRSWQRWSYSGFVYHDSSGTSHPFNSSGATGVYTSTNGSGGTCPNAGTYPTPYPAVATDGSGYTLNATIDSSGAWGTVISVNGAILSVPFGSSPAPGPIAITDANGNQLTVNNAVYTDTLGTTALTVAGTAPSPTTFTYTGPSGPAAYTVSYASYTVTTNFGCPNTTEYSHASYLADRVTLPDNSYYQFTYEKTTSTSASVTGRLASVTLPTGGTISYTYLNGTGTGSDPINCADGTAMTITRTLNPGGGWTYARTQVTGAHWQTKVTDPTIGQNQTVLDFMQDSASNNFYETQRARYAGAATGSPMQTINTCYNTAAPPCTTTAIALPIAQRTTLMTVPGPGNLIAQHTDKFDSWGNHTESDDYDFATAAPFPLLRQTLISYAVLGAYLNSFTQTVTVKDGSGTIKYRQDTNYDQYSGFTGANCITGAPNHDDTSHGCSFTTRGNATSTTTYTNPSGPSGGITQNLTYDSLGNRRTIQDALNNTTTLAYSPDSWANSYCNPSTTSYAYPVSMTNARSQTTTFKYYACAGLVGSVTDPNNQTTNVSYDSLLGPTQETFPDGGQTTVTYNGQTSTQTQVKMDTTPHYITSTLLLDGLGRTNHTQINSDPQGVDYTDTTYDALGRVASVSNPYRSTNDPTYGITSYVYDPLNRICVVVPPDGTAVSGSTCPSTQPTNDIFTTYSNNTTTTTDQAGKKRQSTLDGLGRLTQITEDPGGLGYVTAYTFDVFGNIINVMQNSGRQRTYTYDALNRLLCESNPEIQIATCPNPDNGSYTAGTIRYGYDNNGNLTSRQAPAPNQTGSATVTTTYQYDALNRLTQKSYSDGTTPTAYFAYDLTSVWSTTLTNPVGRLTELWTGTPTTATTGTIFGYDAVGRVVVNNQRTALATYPVGYTYDLAGDTTSTNYLNGFTISQTYDTVGRSSGVTSSLVDSTHPATLVTVDSTLGYYPHGALRKMTPGNGLTQTAAFNKVLQPCRMNVNSSATALGACGDAIPSGNLLDFNYGFNLGSSDNGNVASWTAIGQQAFNRTFTYDSLNRLSTLNQSSGSATGCSSTFNLSWTYDPWGNRTDQTVNSGTCNPFHATVNTKNQLVDPVNNKYQYDAAGNMIQDASHTYFYDAESRLIQVDGSLGTCSTAAACYTYGASGLRIEKVMGTNQVHYFRDLVGNPLVEKDQNSNFLADYIYQAGQLVAEYKNNTTYFPHPDHLGSTRLVTALNQSVAQNLDYLPFGEFNSSDSGITTHEFTGDERDSETGLDHTQFRQYSSSLGRWMHPDPAGLAAVDPSSPQSWNRYAYVLNNPLRGVDSLGLECVWDDGTYDSATDPQTGSDSACTAFGGLWLMPIFFSNFNLPDWTSDPNSDIAKWLSQYASDLTQYGPGINGWGLSGAGDYQLVLLLGNLTNCVYASGMANNLMQMRDSGKLKLGNLGPYDGETSFTGNITIDSANGITAHNLGHEWYHTVQREMTIIMGKAAGASSAGHGLGGDVTGQLAWFGATRYNYLAALFNGTPGFGPLDQEAEAFGQKVSGACGID